MNDTPLTPEHVQRALDAFDFGLAVQHFDEPTATSQQAADAIGVALGAIVKSLCFLIEGKPLIVLASGDQRVDTRKLAALVEVSRKRVKVATPDQCIEFFGYSPGSVPPLAHRTPDLLTYIDDSLRRFDQLYAAGGAPNAIFPVTLAQLQQMTGGQIVDIKRD